MNKKNTILLAFALLGFFRVNAQNVGIGIAVPTAKLHIEQTAGVDAVLVDHTGATGNSLELFPTNAANTSSTLFIVNGTSGAGINNLMLTTTSTASSIVSNNQGLGIGLDVLQANAGATDPALQIVSNGTGNFSRGVDMYLDAANVAIGYTLFHAGTGAGMYTELSNAANTSTGYDLRHAGTGRGLYIDLSEATNASTGAALFHAGTGRASFMSLTNPANAATGAALYHAGTGVGSEIGILNTTSTSMINSLFHDGLGRGQQIVLGNAANTDMGLGIFNSGDGTGQYISMSNTAATNNSLGLIVNYNGTNGGTGGGGNAVEIQHFGSNGNAVDVFMGDPNLAAGNSVSEYAALSVSHMATGTSPTPGLVKTAISASNNSADPTVLVNNNGTEDGSGMEVFITPVLAANQAAAIYSQSAAAAGGAGIGVFGFGGDLGIVGSTNGGNNLGLFSNTDFAAVGVKAFMIDYPLDPANKTLRHFCIESNEVLNMYRGLIELDANGQAIIELPDYFDAININPSYQLTAIGTATQPYVLSEISNNQFVIAGAPNTKVSWTIHAQRNDPTIQYYSSKIDNYTTNVRMKRPHEVGKYFTPEAYGQQKEQGIFYNASRAKNHEERNIMAKQQKAMAPAEVKVSEGKTGVENQEKAPKQEMRPIKERTAEMVSKR